MHNRDRRGLRHREQRRNKSQERQGPRFFSSQHSKEEHVNHFKTISSHAEQYQVDNPRKKQNKVPFNSNRSESGRAHSQVRSTNKLKLKRPISCTITAPPERNSLEDFQTVPANGQQPNVDYHQIPYRGWRHAYVRVRRWCKGRCMCYICWLIQILNTRGNQSTQDIVADSMLIVVFLYI